jgi:hypothetical protein
MSSIAAARAAPGCAVARTFTSVIPAVANGRHVVEPERLDDWCSWASARESRCRKIVVLPKPLH